MACPARYPVAALIVADEKPTENECLDSLVPQGIHRLQARGAARGYPSGAESHDEQQ